MQYSLQQWYEYYTVNRSDEVYQVLLPMVDPRGTLVACTSTVHCVVPHKTAQTTTKLVVNSLNGVLVVQVTCKDRRAS